MNKKYQVELELWRMVLMTIFGFIGVYTTFSWLGSLL